MQMNITIKKVISVITVWFSLLKDNIYVSVSEIATFLNLFLGTSTITGQKINDMLYQARYQDFATEEEQQIKEIKDIKYVPLNKSDGKVKLDRITREDKEINRLKWKASVILDVFDIDIKAKDFEIADSFIFGANEYNLINTSKEDINYDVLIENISALKENLEKNRS